MKQQATFRDSFSNILLNFAGMSVTVLGYKIFCLLDVGIRYSESYFRVLKKQFSNIDSKLVWIINLRIPIIIYLGIYYPLLIGNIQSVING